MERATSKRRYVARDGGAEHALDLFRLPEDRVLGAGVRLVDVDHDLAEVITPVPVRARVGVERSAQCE